MSNLCQYDAQPGGRYRCRVCRHETPFENMRRVCPLRKARDGAVKRYMLSSTAWALAGFPVREEVEVERILRDVCQPCERYHRLADDVGACLDCGCLLSKMGGLTNKIRRATEHCPRQKW